MSSDIFTIDGFTSEGLTVESMGWAILGAVIISIASLIGRWVFKILRIL
jgi:putative membrane protein